MLSINEERKFNYFPGAERVFCMSPLIFAEEKMRKMLRTKNAIMFSFTDIKLHANVFKFYVYECHSENLRKINFLMRIITESGWRLKCFLMAMTVQKKEVVMLSKRYLIVYERNLNAKQNFPWIFSLIPPPLTCQSFFSPRPKEN